MPGSRAARHVTASSAWGAQHYLAQLVTSVNVMPHHDSLPGHLRAAVDTALRLAAVVQPHPNNADGQLSAALGVQAAVKHLQQALQMVPQHVMHVGHSLLHTMLFLSVPEVRQAAARLGAVTDDLALPAVWTLPMQQYTHVVHVMGWDVLLLECVQLITMSCCHVTSQSRGSNSAPAAVVEVLRLLQAFAANHAALGHGLLSALSNTLTAATAEAGGAQPAAAAPGQVVAGAGNWRVVAAVLMGLVQADQAKQQRPAVAATPPLGAAVNQCISLSSLLVSACKSSAVHGEADSTATDDITCMGEQAVLQHVVHVAAGLLEQQLCDLQEQMAGDAGKPGPAADDPARAAVAELEGQLSQLSGLMTQHGQSQMQAALLRLKCRISLCQPVLSQASAQQPSTSTADSTAHIAASFLARAPRADVSETDTAIPSDTAVQDERLSGITRNGFAGSDLHAMQHQASLIPSAWSQAVRPIGQMQSRHGLPPDAVCRLQTMYNPGLPRHQTPTTFKLPTDYRGPPYSYVLQALALPASAVWEQQVTGWVLACLTPGLPCCLHLQLSPVAVSAAGAGTYGPFRVSLAFLQLAAAQVAARQEAASWNLLALHPHLMDLLLSVSVSVMQLVVVPEQQHALQHLIHSNLLCQILLSHLSQDSTARAGASAALVTHSNRTIADALPAAGVAMGSSAQEKLVAGAACQVLPYAVLMPELLLHRMLQDSIQHPGQMQFIVQLLSGPLRPTAQARLPNTFLPAPASNTGLPAHPVAVADSADVAPAARSTPAVASALYRIVLDMCSNTETVSESAQRAVQSLMSLVLGPSSTTTTTTGATTGDNQQQERDQVVSGGLISQEVAVVDLVLPLLQWCDAQAALHQVRPLVSLASHVLTWGQPAAVISSDHSSSTGGVAAGGGAPPGCVALVIRGAAACMMRVAISLCARLQAQAKQSHPAVAALEHTSRLIEVLVAGLQQALSQPSLAAEAGAAARQLLDASTHFPRPQLLMTLPLLHACTSALTRSARPPVSSAARHAAQEAQQGGQDEEEEGGEMEDSAGGWSSRLLKELMPATVWRATARSSESKALAAQAQLEEAVWFAASSAQHAQQLLGEFHAWAVSELEDLQQSQGPREGPRVAACDHVISLLDWLQRQLPVLTAAGADSGLSVLAADAVASPLAITCARGMQRQLCRAGSLTTQVLQALATVLPALSTPQANRAMYAVIAAAMSVDAISGSSSDPVPAWVASRLAMYHPNSVEAASDGENKAFVQLLRSQFGMRSSNPEVDSQEVGWLGYLAFTVHALCEAACSAAKKQQAVAAAESGHAARCMQLLVGLLPSLMGALEQLDEGSQAVGLAPWTVSAVLLPELLSCWQQLAAEGCKPDGLQVAVLHLLRVLLQPPVAPIAQEQTEAAEAARIELLFAGSDLLYHEAVRHVGHLMSVACAAVAKAGPTDAGGLQAVRMATVQMVEAHLCALLGKDVCVDRVLGFSLEGVLMATD